TFQSSIAPSHDSLSQLCACRRGAYLAPKLCIHAKTGHIVAHCQPPQPEQTRTICKPPACAHAPFHRISDSTAKIPHQPGTHPIKIRTSSEQNCFYSVLARSLKPKVCRSSCAVFDGVEYEHGF